MKVTGSAPSPGEIDLLMMMSGVYISSLNDYRDKSHDLVPPYDGRSQEEIDKMISEKMKRSLARFKNAN